MAKSKLEIKIEEKLAKLEGELFHMNMDRAQMIAQIALLKELLDIEIFT
jgi:hypothetical protein